MSSIQAFDANQVQQVVSQAPQAAGRRAHHEPTPEMRKAFEQKFESAASAAGLDLKQLSDIRSQVGDVLKSAGPNASAQDKQAADDKINDVLKQNGIDPEQFKAKLESVFKSMGAGRPHGGHHAHKPDGDADDAAQSPQQGGSNAATNGASSPDIASLLQHLPPGSLIDGNA